MHHLRLASFGILAAALLGTPVTAQQQAPQKLPRPGESGQPPAPSAQQPKQPQAAPPQAQQPGRAAQPPQAAASKPYKPVAVSEPKPLADPSWAAFRKQLEEIAKRKDRNALAALVVPQGFFWMKEDGDGADKRKSGIDNLATALGLANQDGSGWELLGDFASDETAMPFPDRQGIICSPAGPQFDAQELEKLAQSTQTDIGDWGYTVENGVEVRGAARANAPVIEKLGVHFVRVMEDTSPNASSDFIRIVTPSGKIGFIAADAIVPLGSDQLCYTKDASGAWKIAGFLGSQ